MPFKSKKPCRAFGCCNLAVPPALYCDDHNNLTVDTRKSYFKDYKKTRLDVKEQSFYTSKIWAKTRTTRLILDNYLCQHCMRDNKIKAASVVHHIIEVKKDWSKRLDIDNLISLCSSCHQKVHKSN